LEVKPVRVIGCIKGYLDATTSVSTNGNLLYLSMLWKMSLKFSRAPSGVKQGNLVMPDYGDVGGSVMMCKNTQVKRGVSRQGLRRVLREEYSESINSYLDFYALVRHDCTFLVTRACLSPGIGFLPHFFAVRCRILQNSQLIM